MAQTARSNEAEKATDNVAAISSRTADRAADATREAADNLAAMSRRAADKGADAAREATEGTRDAVRRGFQAAQRTAGAALEVERAVARRSAEGATEVGRAFAELLKEQARDNAAAFRSLTDTFWDQAARIQADLLRASFERTTEFTRRYLEAVQAVTASAVSAAKEHARKAG